MLTGRRHSVIAWTTVALSVAQWGCAATRHATPNRPREVNPAIRSELRTIALPSARYLPEADLKAPTSGKGMGAVVGAGRGIAAGSVPGLAIAGGGLKCMSAGGKPAVVLCAPVAILGLGVAAVGSTFGALFGAAHGAATAESADKIAAAERELKEAIVRSNVQDGLRDRVLEGARDRCDATFVGLAHPGPSVADEEIDYRPWVDDSVDAILHVSLRQLRFERQGGGGDPPLVLLAEARVRLIRASDGIGLYSEVVQHRGGSLTFAQWTADDVHLFREELDRASVDLVETILGLLCPRRSEQNQ